MTTVQNTEDHRAHPELPGATTLREAVSLLDRLTGEPSFLEAWMPRLLEEAEQAEDWYVAHRSDASDRSLSMLVFVWPPGT